MKLDDFKQLLTDNGISLDETSAENIKNVYTKINKEITAVKQKALNQINKGEIANEYLTEQGIDIDELKKEQQAKTDLESRVEALLTQINDLQAQNEQEKLNTIKSQAENKLFQNGVKEKFNEFVLDKIKTDDGYDFSQLELLKENDPELFVSSDSPQVVGTHSINVPEEKSDTEKLQEFLEKNM